MPIAIHDLDSRYSLIRHIGGGNFGEVWLGAPLTPISGMTRLRRYPLGGNLVAIKTLKVHETEAKAYQNYREYQFYTNTPEHSHIVILYELFVDPSTVSCHLVMEPLDLNLFNLIKSQGSTPLDLGCIKSIANQVLSGLSHVHQHGFLHRDLKPENVMLYRMDRHADSIGHSPRFVAKLGDFGLARRIDSQRKYTSYVSTRWYRAPELLFLLPYSYPMDVWAFGTLIAELANLKPLFPGNSTVGQINCHLRLLGTPRTASVGGQWEDYSALVRKLNLPFDFV